MDPRSEGVADKDKSQSKRIQSTELDISDCVAKIDRLDGLTIKELEEGIVSWTERQKDRWTL